MILYCAYDGTVFGADVDERPELAFCCPECASEYDRGATLPPEIDPMLSPSQRAKAQASANEAYADYVSSCRGE